MNDWIELKDLQAVALAQADGWEIERLNDHNIWGSWSRTTWSVQCQYRGRPKPERKVVRVREAVMTYGIVLATELQVEHCANFLGWVKGSEWREVEYE